MTRRGLPRPGRPRALRRGRPAPRAHPARPEGGPAPPDPRHAPQPLPHLLPPPRRRLAAHRARRSERALGRGHRRRGHHPPRLAGRATPPSTRRSPASWTDGELLIADGHHRYETALAYQREVGEGKGADHVLMALVSLEDPGLTVFATHRLLKDLTKPSSRRRIRDAAKRALRARGGAGGRAGPGARRPARQLRLHGLPPPEALAAAA